MAASSSSASIITLPKGGGAQHVLGEKFSPDLHTGTGNFTVPIALPPGRNGFQPQLNLVYSTGNGSGPFGLGWGLSISGVNRKTSNLPETLRKIYLCVANGGFGPGYGVIGVEGELTNVLNNLNINRSDQRRYEIWQQ